MAHSHEIGTHELALNLRHVQLSYTGNNIPMFRIPFAHFDIFTHSLLRYGATKFDNLQFIWRSAVGRNKNNEKNTSETFTNMARAPHWRYNLFTNLCIRFCCPFVVCVPVLHTHKPNIKTNSPIKLILGHWAKILLPTLHTLRVRLFGHFYFAICLFSYSFAHFLIRYFRFFFLSLLWLKVMAPSSGFLDFAISMRPDYHQAIIDTIRFYGWDKIIYLYDSHDGKCLLLLDYIYFSLALDLSLDNMQCNIRV